MQQKLEDYVVHDEEKQELYCSEFWLKLITLFDPQKSEEFKLYHGKIPLQVMVNYTQAKFLITPQRPAVEPINAAAIYQFLEQQGHMQALPLVNKIDYALFLGMIVPVNLFKRVFFLYGGIVKDQVKVKTLIILGNSEPFTQHRQILQTIIQAHRHYFRKDIEEIPQSMTMQEVMLFIVSNLNWPPGKSPTFVTIKLPHPCNTNAEAQAVVDYLKDKWVNRPAPKPAFFSSNEPTTKPSVQVLSHQPYVDRQGWTVQLALQKAMPDCFDCYAAGCGINSYPSLINYPDSTLKLSAYIDNLARLLYEINQNSGVILAKKSSQEQQSVLVL